MDDSTVYVVRFVRHRYASCWKRVWTLRLGKGIRLDFFLDLLIVIQFIKLFLFKLIGIKESAMAILAYSSAVGDYTIKAMATEPWQLYLGILVNIELLCK